MATAGSALERTVDLLLVDDDEQWARATARLLDATGDEFDVEVAHSLAAGRDRFREHDHECVVCDYQLGDGTGLALLETVRAIDSDRPFVLVTGRGDERVASEAIGQGVTDYIPKNQDDDEATVLANRVSNAVTSWRARHQLARERRGKAATLGVLTSTTNLATLSAEFCRVLVDEQGYAAAWIGGIDTDSDRTVVPRAAAGCDSYLEAVIPTESPAESVDPAIRATSRDEPLVVTAGDDIDPPADSDDTRSWQQIASQHGFTSGAGVPIRHDGVRVGVLGVYDSGDGLALDAVDRELLAEYAEIIGHAHRTAGWKRSLLSDLSIRVEIEIGDTRAPLVELSTQLKTASTIEVLSTIETADEMTRYCAHIEASEPDVVSGAASRCDSIDCDTIERSEEGLQCDLYTMAPTPERLLAAHGAQLDRTVVTDGVATLSAMVSDHDTVSSLIDALETEYHTVTISTLWNEAADRPTAASGDPLESLTDRQRDILRYAYFDGYFEQPRGVSATELAEKFDLARATLTQHLRAGQRKLFTHHFDS